MPWGRIDDDLHAHPKLAVLGSLMLPAIGLHFLAISWANKYLTDGSIPTDQLLRLAGDLRPLAEPICNATSNAVTNDPVTLAVTLAEVLVDAGFWEKTAPIEYKIHDFLAYNKSKKQVLNIRKGNRKRLDRWRDRNAVTNATRNAVTNALLTPNPKPVPVPNNKKKKRGALSDDEFVASLKTNPAYAGLDIDRELAKADDWIARHPGRKKTRLFVEAWLNRCDAPLAPTTNGHAPQRQMRDDGYPVEPNLDGRWFNRDCPVKLPSGCVKNEFWDAFAKEWRGASREVDQCPAHRGSP